MKPRTTDAQCSEEIAFTARPKIKSQSQIFRYCRSIFCLPHRPKFSDFFNLCLHWVSVVRASFLPSRCTRSMFYHFASQKMVENTKKHLPSQCHISRDFTSNKVECMIQSKIQVNLFQKHSFLHQLNHNISKDCSLNYKFSTRKIQV